MDEKLNSLLRRVLDLGEADVRTDLAMEDVPRWDSLIHMDLITSLEREFSIQLTLDDILVMRSLDKIRAIVREKVKSHGQ